MYDALSSLDDLFPREEDKFSSIFHCQKSLFLYSDTLFSIDCLDKQLNPMSFLILITLFAYKTDESQILKQVVASILCNMFLLGSLCV